MLVCLVLVHGVRICAKQSWPSKRGVRSGTLEALHLLARGFELDLDNKLPLAKHMNHLKVRKKTRNI